MTIVGLDHVQVAGPRGCEDEARRFYGELVGLTEIPKPPELAARGGVWFAVGEQQLHVGICDPVTPAIKAHPAIRVASRDDLDVIGLRLALAFVAVRWCDMLPGHRRFFVYDPWGNRLEMLAAA